VTVRARSVQLLGAVVLAVGLAAPAGATLQNGGFESGTSSWTTTGDVSVVDSSFGVNPTEGSFQILLSTNGSSTAQTESDLNLPSGAIQSIFDNRLVNAGLSTGSGPIEGAAIQQSFSVPGGGDTLQFDFMLLTDELTPESVSTDFLWWYLERPVGNAQTGVIGHVNDTGFATSSTVYNEETGQGTFTLNLGPAGNYAITLGIHDVEDAFRNTGAIFDNIYLVKSPEPETAALLGMGLLGLAWQGRRRAPRL
jgi:hypothetical protein